MRLRRAASTAFTVAALLGAAALPAFDASAAPPAAGTRWLAVVATRDRLAAAVAAAEALRRSGGSGLEIVSSDDCGNLRPGLFLVVPAVTADRTAADADVAAWRRTVPDAYLRACDPAPQHRLAFGVPLLDPSIEQRPPDTVNWTLDDATSRVNVLANGAVAVVVPYYEPAPEDPREGLRIRVGVIPSAGGELRPLDSDCLDPEFAAAGALVAVACVTGEAGESLTHATRVYELPSGRRLLQQDNCRSPRLTGGRLSCDAEQVDANGQLHLRRIEVRPAG